MYENIAVGQLGGSMEKITCGCTCHEIDADDPNIVKLNEAWWNPICALKENVRLLAQTQEELAKMRAEVARLSTVDINYKLLVRNVESLVCPGCARVVSDQWAFTNGQIICVECMQSSHPGYF